MLLPVSSQAIGDEAELEGAVGRATGDGGVPNGEAMVRFAEAATRGSEDLAASRSDLIAAIGPFLLSKWQRRWESSTAWCGWRMAREFPLTKGRGRSRRRSARTLAS